MISCRNGRRRNSIRKTSILLKETFRIDWRQAMKEAEAYSDKNMTNPDFDKKMEAIDLLYQVKYLYQRDDIDGYLVTLDQNRTTLKHDTWSQLVGNDPNPFHLDYIRM